MKKISSKYILIVAGALLLMNLYLCIFVMKQQRVIAEQEITADSTARKAAYYLSTLRQLTAADTTGFAGKDHKVGVYLNMNACSECNKETLTFMRRNFPDKDICIYLDRKFSGKETTLPGIHDLEIKYVDQNPFFKSITPFFFLSIQGNHVLKFSHESNYPEITKLYVENIKKYFHDDRY